jgi:hypothetical protein
MTAIAALTLADGQATPVNHTFNPVNIDQAGIAKWADRSGGIALGYPVVSFSLRAPSKTSRNYKVTAKVVTPVLEVTSPSTSTGIQPAPTKAYDLICNIDMTLPERSTLAQRNDLLAYAKNVLANAVLTAAVQSFESVY